MEYRNLGRSGLKVSRGIPIPSALSRRFTLCLRASVVILLAMALAGSAVHGAGRQSEAVRAFHKMLDRPHGGLRPEVSAETRDGIVVERGTFFSEETERVPFLALHQEGRAGRLPAVIVLHGTGGRKEGMRATLEELARPGYLALAIDARYHGDRVPGGAHGKQEYEEAIVRAWKERDSPRRAHPFYYDTVFDLWRTLDYLVSRPDVDPERIGMIGFSMGGIETWLTAASDPRVRVAVPAIGVQSFRWSLEHDRWQGRARTISRAHEAAAHDLGEREVNANVCRKLWSAVIPGILDEFDGPAMLPLIAPRPLLILNGENDPNCPLEGARRAFAAAEAAYARRGASDHLKIDVTPGVGHAVTPEQRRMAYDWFDRWLRK